MLVWIRWVGNTIATKDRNLSLILERRRGRRKQAILGKIWRNNKRLLEFPCPRIDSFIRKNYLCRWKLYFGLDYYIKLFLHTGS